MTAGTRLDHALVRIRVVTYNIHSGFGRHGYDLDAIQRTIAHEAPDVVALQEVDFGLRRTGYIDQAQWLADRLHLYPVTGPTRRKGRYGNALLSRWPATCIRNHDLTVWPQPGRACLEVHLDLPKITLRCFVTHLGLIPQERVAQASRLIECIKESEDDANGGVLVMGDFNTIPRSQVSHWLRRRFIDAFHAAGEGRAATFHTRLPRVRFDYIYMNEALYPLSCRVAVNPWSDRGSDHLPLVADLHLRLSR
jgi:endonuclease/exonuclease/phosphatase family metal-dependent hydrolase